MKNIYFLIILLFVIGCKSSHNNYTANNQAVVLQFKEDSLIRKEFNRISPEYKFNDLFKTECAKFYKGDNLIEICAFNDQDSTYQKSNFVIVKLINSEVQISDTIFMEQPVYVSSLNLSVDVYNDYFFIAWVTENTQTYIPSTINIKCFNIKTKEKIFQHIVDEVAVGFGRTGTLFACEQANISPDFMCLSKGLTGGYLPLSAVLTSHKIYQAFYDDYQKLTAFLHSHSYTGNALACRAGLATLDIFEQHNVIENNKQLSVIMGKMSERFKDHPHVAEVRQTGMILAIEMVKNKHTREPYAWQERRGYRVYQYALSKGVILRPLGNVIYFMPPYIITEEELLLITQVAWDGLEAAVRD